MIRVRDLTSGDLLDLPDTTEVWGCATALYAAEPSICVSPGASAYTLADLRRGAIRWVVSDDYGRHLNGERCCGYDADRSDHRLAWASEVLVPSRRERAAEVLRLRPDLLNPRDGTEAVYVVIDNDDRAEPLTAEEIIEILDEAAAAAAAEVAP
jgi:hypothetical protein